MNTVIGIDVSAKTLDLVGREGDRKAFRGSANNSAAGHRQIIKQCSKHPGVRVVLEATGIYHLDLSFALDQAGIPLMVLNPKRAKDFMRARGVSFQTDKVDANELCEYGLRMDFVPWKAPSKAEFEVLKIGRAIARLTKDHTRLLNRLHAESTSSHGLAVIARQLKQQLKLIDKQCIELRDLQRSLVKANDLWGLRYRLLLTVKGIDDKSALAILSELIALPDDLSAAQWVKHAGLDPSKKDSGTSVRGKTRVSKRGNARLRCATYMPALSAANHDPNVIRFRDRLIASHHTPLQTVVAVQRKLLHAIHAMFKSDSPWDSSKLVAAEPKTA